MPIHLISGLPGDGKTTTMIDLLLDKAAEGNRPLFVAGIAGMKPGIATVLDDPTEWQKCPDGSLIFVDEAWKWFGHLHNPSRQQTPAHVLALAEHRHRGFDFVWTTQAPSQIYPFARALIGEHWHVVRKFGTKMLEIFKWGELVEDVKSTASRERAMKVVTTIKARTFDVFTSATEHTIKARLPWKIWLIPVALVACVVLVWLAFLMLRPDAVAADTIEGVPGSSLPGTPISSTLSGGSSARVASLEEYASLRAMRGPGLHGSQPIFDGRKAQAEPRTFCIMGGPPEATHCACYTEQVTPITGISGDVCRYVARWGEYDPMRPPLEEMDDRTNEDSPGQEEPEDGRDSAGAFDGISGEPSVVGSPSSGHVWGKPPTP